MTVDDLLDRARELPTNGAGVPSKTQIQKALKVHFYRASEIHRQLTAETATDTDAAEVQESPEQPPEEVQDSDLPPLPEPLPEAPRTAPTWPVLLLTLPAFVVIWSGWVDMGRLTGFGVVHPLPGIADGVSLNTAITLPIGLETYAAYALWVWLSGTVGGTARAFARWSAIGALCLGAAGQVAYHLMIAAGMTQAPWWITTAVSCLPVAVLGLGAALAHLVRAGGRP